jgi:hypothetical protein
MSYLILPSLLAIKEWNIELKEGWILPLLLLSFKNICGSKVILEDLVFWLRVSWMPLRHRPAYYSFPDKCLLVLNYF